MKKIECSILEFDYHPEVLRNTCNILRGSGIRVKIFTSLRIWNAVNLTFPGSSDEMETFLWDEEETSFQVFFEEQSQVLNASDVIILNTIASKYKFYSSQALTPAVIIRIHNANTYFGRLIDHYQPRLTPFFIWKDLSHFIRKTLLELDWYYRNKFIRSADYFAFPNDIIRDHATEKFKLSRRKTLSLPFSYVNEVKKKCQKSAGEGITMTVIGKIDKRNRDYLLLLRSFEHLNTFIREIDFPLKLVLLGAPKSFYGKKVVRSFKDLETDNFSVVTFEGFVKQELFTEYIRKTDFLISPINLKTRFSVYTEAYGYTKISGSINDIIAHQKPAIIPAAYPLEDDLKRIVKTYHDEKDLAAQIRDWCENKTFLSLNTEEAFSKYQLSTIQKKYVKTLENIVQPSKTGHNHGD